jgi:hypothetical protein
MSDTAQALIQRVTDTLYAPFRYSGSGIPEGVQTSEPGWIYRDTNNGLLWFKKTGSAATGWKAIAGPLSTDTTQTGNVGTGEDTLQTFTIPAGMLKDNGDAIRLLVVGTFANNSNARTLKVKFGSATILQRSSTNGSGAAIPWQVEATIIRTAATTQKIVIRYICWGDLSATENLTYTTGAQDLTAAVAVTVTGEGTATDDIVKQMFQLEFLPATS